ETCLDSARQFSERFQSLVKTVFRLSGVHGPKSGAAQHSAFCSQANLSWIVEGKRRTGSRRFIRPRPSVASRARAFNSLECKVRKGTVCIGHAVHVFTVLDGCAFFAVGVGQLVGQAIAQGLALAGASGLKNPCEGQVLLAATIDF